MGRVPGMHAWSSFPGDPESAVVPKPPQAACDEEASQPHSQQQSCHPGFAEDSEELPGNPSSPWGQREGSAGAGQTSASLGAAGCRTSNLERKEHVNKPGGGTELWEPERGSPQPECDDEQATYVIL